MAIPAAHKITNPPASAAASLGEPGANLCYQCMTCTLGCPAADKMDVLPHAVMRMVQLGDIGVLLDCGAIWKCLSCQTCYSRCPNKINVPAVIDKLKWKAFDSAKAKNISASFHQIFLDGVKSNGLLFELGLMLKLKLAMKNFFSDTLLGVSMIMKGKLPLFPHRLKEIKAIRKIFEKSGM
ncbi:MAG: 4Fe-4S dicluster domain-containing protein [Leptospirales bacterium]|nr:4Fe-4S dicluster domain-containing protein [Leptospirales bacterium]